jgi:nucleoid-associated protein YgaU
MISTLNRPVAVAGPAGPARRAAAERPVTRTRAGAPVRLTRRGRWVLLLLVTVVATVGWALSALGPVSADTDAAQDGPAVSSTWVVQPGETLWVIAERVAPDTDPRETVARIVAMNDLPDSSVLIGQELQIPA